MTMENKFMPSVGLGSAVVVAGLVFFAGQARCEDGGTVPTKIPSPLTLLATDYNCPNAPPPVFVAGPDGEIREIILTPGRDARINCALTACMAERNLCCGRVRNANVPGWVLAITIVGSVVAIVAAGVAGAYLKGGG